MENDKHTDFWARHPRMKNAVFVLFIAAGLVSWIVAIDWTELKADSTASSIREQSAVAAKLAQAVNRIEMATTMQEREVSVVVYHDLAEIGSLIGEDQAKTAAIKDREVKADMLPKLRGAVMKWVEDRDLFDKCSETTPLPLKTRATCREMTIALARMTEFADRPQSQSPSNDPKSQE